MDSADSWEEANEEVSSVLTDEDGPNSSATEFLNELGEDSRETTDFEDTLNSEEEEERFEPNEILRMEPVSENSGMGDFQGNEGAGGRREDGGCWPTTIPPGEEIATDGDDSMFGSSNVPVPSIHISQMKFCSKEDAEVVANYILDVLEDDLYNYFNVLQEDEYGKEEVLTRTRLKRTSDASIDSNYSDPLPGEASQLNLFYEYEAATAPSYRKDEFETKDEACEASIHRSRGPKKVKDTSTVTREMAFVDPLTAELVFRHNYPLKDDYKPPEVPSRKASLDGAMEKAAIETPDVDRPRIGPKIRWGKRARLLPPLPQDYFKEETFWTGSVFRGQYINRQLHHGRFEFPLMAVYESEFEDGQAHSKKHLGCIVYPRGDKFEGEWVKGRHISGKITFADDLKFEQHKWNYCTPPDRRLYIEKDIGIKQAGKTLFNDRFPPPYIPPGQYDTGYGVFDPDTGVVRGYSGEKLRDASYAECKWILQACRKVKKMEERYKGSFNESRFPGSSVESFVKQ